MAFTGEVIKHNGNFGFIKCDEPGSADMFLIPQACHAFGRELPPIGTRVQFEVVTDAKTGKPRADNVVPENGDNLIAAAGGDPNLLARADSQIQGMMDHLVHSGGGDAQAMAAVLAGEAALAGQATGTIASVNGNFGFIKQDSGESDMFVLPPFPPVGARVCYDIIDDPKTGRPRAENVQQLGAPAAVQQQAVPAGGKGMHGCRGMAGLGTQATGTMASISGTGKFGFIKQDSGDTDMFALPPFAPIGSRVTYFIVLDPKTGRPRAENLQQVGGGPQMVPSGYGPALGSKGGPRVISPYGGGGGGCFGKGGCMGGGKGGGGKGGFGKGGFGKGGCGKQALAPPSAEMFSGTVSKAGEKFGFIQQDGGGPDMFVIPPSCEAFGRTLPPAGTRVLFRVVQDAMSGRPRAEDVVPGA